MAPFYPSGDGKMPSITHVVLATHPSRPDWV